MKTKICYETHQRCNGHVCEMPPARPVYWRDYVAHIKSRAYRERLDVLLASGLDQSDAQGVADAEFLEAWHTNEKNFPCPHA